MEIWNLMDRRGSDRMKIKIVRKSKTENRKPRFLEKSSEKPRIDGDDCGRIRENRR